MSHPTLSFIVLCYNYERYIGQAIRSILDQTIQDFEIIVVDDGSSDGSRGVISSFGDPRIRLLVNEYNLGGAASYNRAVQAATGEYLVNLDADDWIAPQKCEVQLAFLRQNKFDVLGSYAIFIDAEGRPHPMAAELNGTINRPHDLNAIEAWVGKNNLIRSSTIVERAAHLRVGLDDPAMVRACDYELWTRFLRAGYRFAVVPEQLTYYRLHARGVTHLDPRGTLLEMIYAMLRNLMPLIEARAAYLSLARMIHWVISQEVFAALLPIERYRLLGLTLCAQELPDFQTFCMTLSAKDGDPALVTAGRRLLATTTLSDFISDTHKTRGDLALVTGARDFWHQTSEAWEGQAKAMQEQSQTWESRAKAMQEQSQAWESQAKAMHEQSQAWENEARAMHAYFRWIYRWIPARVRSRLRQHLQRL